MSSSPLNTSSPTFAFALDVPNLSSARPWVERLAGAVPIFKVGLELFVSAGPDALKLVRDAGARCFLDLKLHDIPTTVAHAVESAQKLGADFLTLHASNGSESLAAAQRVAAGSPLRLLAVSVLTSLDEAQLARLGWAGTSADLVLRWASIAAEAGVSGLVCSAQECRALRQQLGEDFYLVTPGIRSAEGKRDDQKRVMTPQAALAAGSNLLVVGRPIREAAEPREVALELKALTESWPQQ